MARGGGRRTYVRDGNGRFASTPGGGAPKRSTPASRRAATRAGNRLNRDNSGRISGIGRNGATVRGGRLRTAKGNRRATQTASMKVAGFRPGVIAKGGRGVSGRVARSLAAAKRERVGQARPMERKVPAAQRPGSITNTLRGTLRALAQADAARIRQIEGITGQPVRAPKKPAAGTGATVRAPGRGSVSGTLRDNLRSLAQSDARTAREMADLAKPTAKGALKGGSGGRKPKAMKPANKPPLPPKPVSTAKLAKKESKRNISDAKAARIIARIDANRPGLRRASGSDRRTRNALQTHDRASAFVQAASGRARRRGTRIDLAESVRRAVRNAKAKPAKPKPPTPRKPTPQGSGPRMKAARPTGTVAKPKGLRPGALSRNMILINPKPGVIPRTSRQMRRIDRSGANWQRAIAEQSQINEKLKKARRKAEVASNPYSQMSKAQKTRARNELSMLESIDAKLRKRVDLLSRARMLQRGIIGYTPSGRTKYSVGSLLSGNPAQFLASATTPRRKP